MSCISRLVFLQFSILLIAPPALAADWHTLDGSPPGAGARLAAVEHAGGSVNLRLVMPGFWTGSAESKSGPRSLLEIPDGGLTTRLGSPRLPVLRYLVESPPGANISLELTASWQHLALIDLGLEHPLLPVQHPVQKIEGAEELIPYVEDAAVYATNSFLPVESAVVADRAVIRGRHVALIEVRPIRYNPATGALRFWSEADLRVSFEDGLPAAVRGNRSRLASQIYDSWLAREIVELPAAVDEASTRAAAGGAAEGAVGMLVICHDDFATAVAPLLDWKEKKGFKIELVVVSELGASPTDADLKAAIQERYDHWSDPALDYILLVGDTDFTPIHIGSGGSQVTDNWFACLDGSDYLPEIAVGRISTRSAQETADVVDKLLTYEQANFATTDWIKKAGFIGTADYSHSSLIEGTHDDCIDAHYTPNGYLQTAWSHGGESCDRHFNAYGATTADISGSIDEGRSMINYSGHGYPGGWYGAVSGESYTSADVYANSNSGMYPFVVSNACRTSSLSITECYAEAWQKAPNGGGIAHWGASNTTYWDEDDILQRALHDRIFPMDQTPALGLLVNQAKLDLYSHYGDAGSVAYYYDIYTLLADPSLSIWTRAPRDLEITYDAVHPIGEADLAVAVSHQGSPVEGALVAIRKEDEGVFESGYTDSAGEIVLTLDPAPEAVGLMDVTVSGHDCRPHEGDAIVISPDSPWLIHREHVVDDSSGGAAVRHGARPVGARSRRCWRRSSARVGDGHPNPGEDFVMSLRVENIGERPGTGFVGALTTSTTEWCRILDGFARFPDLAPGEQGDSLPNHYQVRVLPDAPDGVMLGFDLDWSADDGSSGRSSFQEQVHAVRLSYDHHSIYDTIVGNGDGVAGAGEIVDMAVAIASLGHLDATDISGTISSSSTYITILQAEADYPDLAAGTQADSESPYRFEVASGAPDRQPVTFDLALSESGTGYSEIVQFDIMISSCVVQDSTDVPRAINDHSTVESLLDYSNAVSISDIDVYVDISHTYRGDLRLILESPAGTRVLLHNRTGSSAHDIVTWYDRETTPFEPLTPLLDENSTGTWKLIVEDAASADTGRLNGWSLEICGDGLTQ